MELKRPDKFCFSLKENINQQMQVGEKAATLSRLKHASINIPEGFALSGRTFDMFLTANSLIDTIAAGIEEASEEGVSDQVLREVSIAINKRIKHAAFPAMIKSEILKFYSGLTEFANASVVVRQSAFNSDLDEARYNKFSTGYTQITGEAELFAAIKQVWADLFSFEALKYRNLIGYEGGLSQPVLIQKQVNADSAGTAYSFDIDEFDEDLYTVICRLGIPKTSLRTLVDDDEVIGRLLNEEAVGSKEVLYPEFTIDSDFYLLQKNSKRIINAKLNKQNFMWVKGGKGGRYSRVKISKPWSEKEKLEQLQLKKIGLMMETLERLLNSARISFDWVIENGTIYVISVRILTDEYLKNLPEFKWQDNSEKSPDPKTQVIEETKGTDAIEITEIENEGEIQVNTAEQGIPVELEINETKEAEVEIEKHPLGPNNAEYEPLVLAEVKTVLETWLDSPVDDMNNLKINSLNFDAVGPVDILSIITKLGFEIDSQLIKKSRKQQKEFAEIVATTLVEIFPKPIVLKFSNELNDDIQSLLISQLKHLYGHKNLSVVLSERAAFQRKSLSDSGLRRSSSFRIFTEITYPGGMIFPDNIKSMQIDGVVINYQSIWKSFWGEQNTWELADENHAKDKTIFSIFEPYFARLLDEDLDVIIEFGEINEPDSKFVNILVGSSITGISVQVDHFYKLKKILAQLESDTLTVGLEKAKAKRK